MKTYFSNNLKYKYDPEKQVPLLPHGTDQQVKYSLQTQVIHAALMRR